AICSACIALVVDGERKLGCCGRSNGNVGRDCRSCSRVTHPPKHQCPESGIVDSDEIAFVCSGGIVVDALRSVRASAGSSGDQAAKCSDHNRTGAKHRTLPDYIAVGAVKSLTRTAEVIATYV